MTLPGETIATGASPNCPDCGKLLELEVLMSAAGYYIGTRCCCGPYSRESHYYDSREALDTDLVDLRTTDYTPNGLPTLKDPQ